MQRLWHVFVWLRRIGHCRGFGIQSPTDYWLVRNVINQHAPYYQYEELGQGDDWLTRKLGRLCFRLANWRQPGIIVSDAYHGYLQAGCRRAGFDDSLERPELVVLPLGTDSGERLATVCRRADERTVLVVDGIWRNRQLWQELVDSRLTGVTFDLYYCGIVLFDKKRYKHNYIINF